MREVSKVDVLPRVDHSPVPVRTAYEGLYLICRNDLLTGILTLLW